MDALRILGACALGLFTGVVSFYLVRPFFECAYGALLPAAADPARVGSRRHGVTAVARGVFRIWFFYALTAGIISLTGGQLGLVTPAGGPEQAKAITLGGLVVGFIFAGLVRFVSVTESGYMLEALMPVVIMFFAMLPVQAMLGAQALHDFVWDVLRPLPWQFPVSYVLVTVVLSGGTELLLHVLWSRFDFARQAPFQLMREYREGFEMGEMVVYRKRVEDICKRVIAQEVARSGLQHLCWKTGTADEGIAEAILDATAAALVGDGYRQEGDAKMPELLRTEAWNHLARLSREGRVSVIVSAEHASHAETVRRILGVEPIAVPQLGRKRYIVVNREAAVIGLPVPPGEEGLEGANVAMVTYDIDRVHECLSEFESICRTHDKSA